MKIFSLIYILHNYELSSASDSTDTLNTSDTSCKLSKSNKSEQSAKLYTIFTAVSTDIENFLSKIQNEFDCHFKMVDIINFRYLLDSENNRFIDPDLDKLDQKWKGYFSYYIDEASYDLTGNIFPEPFSQWLYKKSQESDSSIYIHVIENSDLGPHFQIHST